MFPFSAGWPEIPIDEFSWLKRVRESQEEIWKHHHVTCHHTSHVQWIQRGSYPGNETSGITNNFQKIMLKDRFFDPSKIYLSLFQKTKSTAPFPSLLPSRFYFRFFPGDGYPRSREGNWGTTSPTSPRSPSRCWAPHPSSPRRATEIGKGHSRDSNGHQGWGNNHRSDATTTGGRCSQSSTLRNTYMCLPTKGGTLLCSVVSSLLVFSGLLAFSFADLGNFSNDARSTPTLSSSLFWRCIGVAVFFYIPILVVATPMERNLVFLVAVLVRRVNVFK